MFLGKLGLAINLFEKWRRQICMLFLDSKIENTYSTCKAILIVHKIKITSIKNIGKRERGKGKEEENVDGSIVCDLNETVSIRNERLESL